MKCLGRQIDKEGEGSITLLPERDEDMWHAYNLIAVGDRIRAATIRYGDFSTLGLKLVIRMYSDVFCMDGFRVAQASTIGKFNWVN